MIHPRIPPFLAHLLRADKDQQRDHETARSHAWKNFPSTLPQGLSIRWLGTAGFELCYQDTRILIDPFVTRPALKVAFSGKPLHSHQASIERHIHKADAVLVGHTHFDHAMDVAEILRRCDGQVLGSGSLVRLMALHRLADRAVAVQPYKIYEVGPFAITFVPSVHAKLLAGLAVPWPGEVTCSELERLSAAQYRCGQIFGIHIRVAGITFYHQGSADILDEAVRHREIDYFLAAIVGRGFTPNFTRRTIGLLKPKTIIPHHYDDFFRPLDAPLRFSFNVNLSGFIDEVANASRDVAVRCLMPLEPIHG